MKEFLAKLILVSMDLLTILVALLSTYGMTLDINAISDENSTELLFVLVTLSTLFWEGIYTKRYDFWQEYRRILRALVIACIVLLALFALGKQMYEYSRMGFLSTFLILVVLFPFQKYLLKRWLHRMNIWGRNAAVVGYDPFFENEVFNNPHLGYVRADANTAKTLFIASERQNISTIETILDESVKQNQEVIFIPMIKTYDFSDSYIIHVFNARTNLVVLENKLLNRSNRFMKAVSDYLLSLILLPFALFVMGVIAIAIKLSEPESPILFRQERLGKDGKIFICYKFRTMFHRSDILLQEYLRSNPLEHESYQIYHKYENDPRITPIGHLLRKTSLDELPQIVNVIRAEMSLIGPRPYMLDEADKMGQKITMILSVKPGITGIWQVSGRSDIDFKSRVALDVWYVRNWSLWTDFVILIKTIKVVIKREGAL